MHWRLVTWVFVPFTRIIELCAMTPRTGQRAMLESQTKIHFFVVDCLLGWGGGLVRQAGAKPLGAPRHFHVVAWK
jgi:hypothetical protein